MWRWYGEAAAGGVLLAQVKYADWLVKSGKVKESIEWYEKGARSGDAHSQMSLATYMEGGMAKGDDLGAAGWYRKAAEQGVMLAQYNLAMRLKTGNGVGEDRKEAAVWFRKAAEQGHVGAAYELGQWLEREDGTNLEVWRWYGEAAAGGVLLAQVKYADWGLPRPMSRWR